MEAVSPQIASVASPTSPSGSVKPELLAEGKGQHGPDRVFEANERLDMSVSRSFTLGEPARINLQFHIGKLSKVIVEQLQNGSHGIQRGDKIAGGAQALPVQTDADGTSYITITPLRLGQITLELSAIFPDGGVVHNFLLLDVIPRQKQPEKLLVGDMWLPQRNTPKFFLSMTPEASQDVVNIYAKYDDLTNLIRVAPSFAAFRIITDSGPHPIQLDKQTGVITALHPGQALLETSFGGRKNLTCVVVEPTYNPNAPNPGMNCQQLVPPGGKLGASQ